MEFQYWTYNGVFVALSQCQVSVVVNWTAIDWSLKLYLKQGWHPTNICEMSQIFLNLLKFTYLLEFVVFEKLMTKTEQTDRQSILLRYYFAQKYINTFYK